MRLSLYPTLTGCALPTTLLLKVFLFHALLSFVQFLKVPHALVILGDGSAIVGAGRLWIEVVTRSGIKNATELRLKGDTMRQRPPLMPRGALIGYWKVAMLLRVRGSSLTMSTDSS